MSTGLVINKASYGAGSTTVDVTSAVSSQVKDGVLNFTVSPSVFSIDDPAPGQLKTANITYTINGGSKNSLSVKDGGLVFIDAPPARAASGLQIVKAEYGYAGNFTDVTNAVQNLMKSDGSINFKVGHKQVGLPDPNPNKQKELAVQFTINGAPSTATYTDGETFKLSAPPKESAAAKDSGPSFFGALFSGVWWFAIMFLYVLSIFVSYDFGNYFINNVVLGIFGLLPGFAFWGLPLLMFIVRMFKSQNTFPV